MLYLISNQNNAKNISWTGSIQSLYSTWSSDTEVNVNKENIESTGTKKEEIVEEKIEDTDKWNSDGGNVSWKTDTIVEENIKTDSKINSWSKEEISDSNDSKGDTNFNLKGSTKDASVEWNEAWVSGLDKKASVDKGWMMQGIKDFFTIKKAAPSIENVDSFTWNTDAIIWINKWNDKEVDAELIKKVEDELNEGAEVKQEDSLKVMTFSDNVSESDLKDTTPSKSIVSTWSKNIIEGMKNTLGMKDGEVKGDDSISSWDEKKSIIPVPMKKNNLKKEDKKLAEDKKLVESKKETISNNSTKGLPKHEVSVTSLKMNNAWFTQTLGYVFKWDHIQQLTETNQYGCFKWEVISSQQARNDWKQWWFCEYYMTGLEDTIYAYEWAASKYYGSMKQQQKSVVKAKTPLQKMKKQAYSQIGSMHWVNTHSLKLNNAHFNKSTGYIKRGDRVKQLTRTNAHGCFKVQVVSSKVRWSTNKQGWVCKKYLR